MKFDPSEFSDEPAKKPAAFDPSEFTGQDDDEDPFVDASGRPSWLTPGKGPPVKPAPVPLPSGAPLPQAEPFDVEAAKDEIADRPSFPRRAIGGAGRALKYLGQAVIEAPGAISRDPREAAKVFGESASDTLAAAPRALSNLVASDDQPTREDIEAQRRGGFDTRPRLPSRGPDVTPEQAAEAARRKAERADNQKLANIAGAAAATPITPGGAVGKAIGVGTKAPGFVAGVSRAAHTATAAATGAAVDATTRALARGDTLEDAITEGIETAGSAAIVAPVIGETARQAAKPFKHLSLTGARERQRERNIQRLGRQARPDDQKIIDARDAEVASAVEEFKIDTKSTETTARQAGAALDTVKARREAAIAKADRPTSGADLVNALKAQRDRLAADPLQESKVAVLDRAIEKAEKRYLPDRTTKAADPPDPRPFTSREVVGNALQGASKVARAAASTRMPDLVGSMKKFGLRKHMADHVKLDETIDDALKTTGKSIGEADEAITAAGGGMPMSEVLVAVQKVKAKYLENPAVSKDLAGRIDGLVDNVIGQWKDKFPVVGSMTRVPLSRVRQFSRQLGEDAFTGDATIPPKVAARMRRDLYGAVRDAMKSHADDVLKDSFESSTYPGIREKVAKLGEAEADYAALKTWKKISGPKAVAAKTAPPPPLTTEGPATPAPPPIPKGKALSLERLYLMRGKLKEGSPQHAAIDGLIKRRLDEVPDLRDEIARLTNREEILTVIKRGAETRKPKERFKGNSRFSDVVEKGATITGMARQAAKKALGRFEEWKDERLLASRPGQWINDVAARRAHAQLLLGAKDRRNVAALTAQALQAGVPRDVVDAVVKRYAPDQANAGSDDTTIAEATP
ncbi:MAG TPA: hypothetical protein VFV05_15565 [Methylomirabilota bacterium]|nr:hypothetical protein [Methylomirabilota bacterium]